jgi:hypothetical protein
MAKKKFIGGGSGRRGFAGFPISSFVGLSDAPHSYAGHATDILEVNAGATGIDFIKGRGVPNGVASLDAAGLLPTSQLPPLAISDFLGTAANQPAMLLLLGEVGDWCIRSDLGMVFIITSGDGHLIGNWTQLAYPPTAAHAFGGGLHTADTIANVQTKLSDGSFLTTAPGEINALAAKAAPDTSDLIVIEDAADLNKKKKVVLSNFPIIGKAFVDVTDPQANFLEQKIKSSAAGADGGLNIHTVTYPGFNELHVDLGFSLLTEKVLPVGNDIIAIQDSESSNDNKKVKLSRFMFPRYVFFADNLISPNSADFGINALAPASADSLNNSILIRQFDDTLIEAVAFNIRIPPQAIGITVAFVGRAQTAPGGAVNIDTWLEWRIIRNNTAIGAWQQITNGIFAIPANTRFQFFSTSYAIAADLGAQGDDILQMEFARNGAGGNDTLVGDFNLLNIKVTFI